MRKKFTKSIMIYMLVSILVVIAAVFIYQVSMENYSNKQQVSEKLELVKQKIKSNEEEIARLTADVGQNNLAKTRAFADMLEGDPSILETEGALQEICERLMVRELHVIDEKGIITHSSIPEYVGFDMGSGEQSAAFLKIIDNPELEIVQEPQKNVKEGVVVQYIGVVRKDAEGLVQVGIQPEILEKTLEGTAIDVVLAGYDFGTNGYIFAIDKASGEVLAHGNKQCIGKKADEIGFPKELKAGSGTAKIDGKKGFYTIQEYDGMWIGTMLPTSEYYSQIFMQTIVVSLALLIINAVLIFMINRYVSRNIVKGIVGISDATRQIAEGNYDVLVQENGNEEFMKLSSDINKMVENITNNLQNNKELLNRQQEDMQKSAHMLEQIKEVSSRMEDVSKQTLSGAISIHEGSEDQKSAIEGLRQTMGGLSDTLLNNAKTASDVSKETLLAVNELVDTKKMVLELAQSMEEISKTSQEIEEIIVEIDQIAEQTNLLSLNASIEAARAGETGKGFAVVASEVGALADRSSEAVKKTAALIQNSLDAVAKGREITNEAVNEFGVVVGKIQDTSQDVEQISKLMDANVEMVLLARDGLNAISDVVEKNVEIAMNSEDTARSMADEATYLMNIVEQPEG